MGFRAAEVKDTTCIYDYLPTEKWLLSMSKEQSDEMEEFCCCCELST